MAQGLRFWKKKKLHRGTPRLIACVEGFCQFPESLYPRRPSFNMSSKEATCQFRPRSAPSKAFLAVHDSGTLPTPVERTFLEHEAIDNWPKEVSGVIYVLLVDISLFITPASQDRFCSFTRLTTSPLSQRPTHTSRTK